MNTNINSSNKIQPNSGSRIPSDKKRECVQKMLFIGLFVVGAIILIAVVGSMCFSSFCSKDKKVEKMAVESLRMKAGNPRDFKVTAISKMDSIFVNRYCPEHETMELSQKYLDYTIKMMEASANKDVLDDAGSMIDYKKFSKASDALDVFNEMLQKPKGEFMGWRMRLRYTYTDENNRPSESEAWLMFDRDKKFIFHSFEFPML